MDRRNLRWGVLLVLWCVAGLKLAAMKVESLDHGWFFNRGYESQAAGKVTVDLPHTWNAADAMFGNVDYYRGMSNYSRFTFTCVFAGEGRTDSGRCVFG